MKLSLKTPCTTWTFDELMACVFGIKVFDVHLYFYLLKHGPFKVNELAEKLNKNRSTIQRSVQNLMNAGLVYRKQVNLKDGGYFYLYYAVPFEEVKERMKREIEGWYKKMKDWIDSIELEDLRDLHC
ncbi:transcriptional regulator, TrmB [Methanocaldococcus infernus ME]|uniref:Transcriptional regulator, TrmB n=1 Tax=Methanocaldococcus infernus (strain DSM 11812 / JCM 15783 / ME) TaxID=573063 RepID=D5VTF7_METIM|nr:helix-turn-helix domain-containing protein [Methanocaldococcus infernus]ADG13860.1 transcriptional regulator, TrmB [Methanocaldococcus infernus ME]